MSDIVCLKGTSSNFDDICHLTEVSFHYDLANAKYNLELQTSFKGKLLARYFSDRLTR
jgi:hypothetical protein